jgi:hypothetical protein
LRRAIDVQSATTNKISTVADCHDSHTEVLRFFYIARERMLSFRIMFSKDGTGPPAVPIKAMRCNARMALIVFRTRLI